MSWKVDRVLANQSLFHDRGYTGHFQHSHCLVSLGGLHRQARVFSLVPAVLITPGEKEEDDKEELMRRTRDSWVRRMVPSCLVFFLIWRQHCGHVSRRQMEIRP